MKHLLLFMCLPVLAFGQEAKPVSTPTASSASQSSIGPLTAPSAYTIPGVIQAEYSTDSGVVVAPTTDTSGSQEIDSIDKGDWMEYGVYISSAGMYAARFRVATAGPGASFELVDMNNRTVLDTVYLPNTGGLTKWQTVTVEVNLPVQGLMGLRVSSTSTTNWNFNWMDFELPNTPPPSQAQAIPGMVQAESYFHMSGVQTQATTDVGQGLNVGWIDMGDYMDYYINVPTENFPALNQYTFSFRLATPYSNASFEMLDLSGNDPYLRSVSVPNTGGFQNWQTINVSVQLSPGLHVLRLQSTSWDIWNINWIFVVQGYQNPSEQTAPGVIQAEWYIWENGVATQPTTDSAGGNNVGWIDNQDWVNYQFYVTDSGNYMAGFRVATPYNNASFQVLDNTGNVLANVTVPNTGGFQNWKTVTVPLHLKPGADTVWIESTSWDIWNFNWMEFTPVKDTVAAAAPKALALDAVDAAFLQTTGVWPNPVRDLLTVQMNDTLSGKMVVQLVDQSGIVREVTELVKMPGASQFNINTGGLSSGVYFVRIIIGDQVQVRKVLRL